MSRVSRIVAGGLLASTALLSTGCVVSGHSSNKVTGSYVGASTFQKIEEGVTTEEWVLAALGVPTSEATLEDGTKLWKWSYEERRKSRGALLFVFGGSSDHVSQGGVYAELRDGIVQRTWRD